MCWHDSMRLLHCTQLVDRKETTNLSSTHARLLSELLDLLNMTEHDSSSGDACAALLSYTFGRRGLASTAVAGRACGVF